MVGTSIWPAVDRERASLHGDLSSLGDERWETESLCRGWSVRDVLAHLSATARMSPGGFLSGMVAAGFRFDRLQDRGIASERGASPEETLARFERIVTSRRRPPGPAETMLGEVLVHSEDIRRPLRLTHDYDLEAAARAARFFAGSNLLIGSKRRIAGVTLRATDTDFTHGDGPLASGPMMSLLLAMTGRRAALADLEGDGVAVLSSR